VAAALDYSNLVFAFAILTLGVAAALIIFITEKESFDRLNILMFNM
jgi:hypothetical protein